MLYRALEHIDLAAKSEPNSALQPFVRLKVHLLQDNTAAAVQQLQTMLGCEDFTHELLRVSADCVMLFTHVAAKHGNQTLGHVYHDQACCAACC